MTFNPAKTYCIIEDIPDVRDRLRREMDAYPAWECMGMAESVRQAKALLDAQRPMLIFCDWDLVGGSGFEVLQHLQQMHRYNPFIIFNTGFQSDHPEIAEELINTYKVDAFINKPYWQKLLEQLPDLLVKAANKAGNHNGNETLHWLKLANGEKVRTDLRNLMAILQCPENPRHKLIYFHQKTAPVSVAITWPEASLLFEKAGLASFPINKRYALIGKAFIQRYQSPFVWVGHPALKLEVVKENQKQFEDWLGAR